MRGKLIILKQTRSRFEQREGLPCDVKTIKDLHSANTTARSNNERVLDRNGHRNYTGDVEGKD